MPGEMKGSDWKKFRAIHEVALDRFCEKVVEEVKRIAADGALSNHEKYVDILQFMLARMKDIERTFDNPRHSTAVIALADMKEEGLVKDDELNEFGDEVRRAVTIIEEIRNNHNNTPRVSRRRSRT